MPSISAERPVPIELTAIYHTKAGYAAFFNEEHLSLGKVILIYMDCYGGFATRTTVHGKKLMRPMTHDLMKDILVAFGVKLRCVYIVSREDDGLDKDAIYKALVILEMDNEVEPFKIVEVDARPSDALALSIRMNAPLYIKKSLWMQMEDVSSLLNDLRTSYPEAGIPDFP
ncbi:MAG: DUF151 domain-containing protein [Akkermansia sp.]